MIILAVIVILLGFWFFLISPALRKHPDSELCKNMYVAHRGFHNKEKGIPENSLAAFTAAMDNGYAIEIDIHTTKDGEVVIFHDDTTDRMCGVSGVIEQMTLEELKRLSLGDTNEKIPTLSELLEICRKDTVLVIEYKCTPKNYKILCEKADIILSKYNVKYIVQSFNPFAMGWFKKNKKDILRGQLATYFIKENKKNFVRILCGFLLFNFVSRPDFVSYKVSFTNTLPRRICALLGCINAGWTIRDQDTLDKYKKHYSIYIFENFTPKKDA
jgi:hypothetical protein